jgi:hypothetical protein
MADKERILTKTLPTTARVDEAARAGHFEAAPKSLFKSNAVKGGNLLVEIAQVENPKINAGVGVDVLGKLPTLTTWWTPGYETAVPDSKKDDER